MRVQPFEPAYLPGLRALANNHLSAVVPGWALTDRALETHLYSNYAEPITDPWVTERVTLLATEGWAVLAAVHLLRYGTGEEVGEYFRGVGEILWLLSVPGRSEAAATVLSEVRQVLGSWGVRREEVCSGGLPVPTFGGVPDRWPHVAETLAAAGYTVGPEHREALYGGEIARVLEPGVPPLPGLEVTRNVGRFGVRFSAGIGNQEVGHLECATDLTEGGALPAFRGWAELSELWVREDVRGRGVGGWLLGHAAGWLRLARCGRVVISVDERDEAAGAGRFYNRFGWRALARVTRSWKPPGTAP